jgi:TRAP-type mannitol/chloroaromatic compound transport system permease small subunit
LLEAQWYLFSIVFLLGASVTLRRDEHVRVDVLFGRLSPRGKAWVDLLGGLLLLLPFCVFAIVYSLPGAVESLSIREQSPDPGGLPRYPLKLLLPMSFVLLAAQGGSEIAKRVLVLTGHAPLDAADVGERTGARVAGEDR